MATKVPLTELAARRIALIKPSALGDIVHSLPILTALRRRFPSAHITWVINQSYQELIADHPDLNAALPFDRAAVEGGPLTAVWTYGRFFRQLRRQRFDLAVDLQGLLRTGLMSAATGAGRRVGLSTAREGACWFYTDVVPVADYQALHAVDRYWLVAEALGVGDGAKVFHVPLPAAARAWAAERLGGLPRPWLMLGVGARWQTKRWPAEHFAVLARRMQSAYGGSVIVVGSAADAAPARDVLGRLRGPACDLTGQTSLPRLAAVLAEADAMLANDSGPLHLAAALGRPVVAPYTCTRARLCGPYGCAQGAIETRVWCRGSYLRHCSRLECMTELSPDRLWPPLREILEEWARHRRIA